MSMKTKTIFSLVLFSAAVLLSNCSGNKNDDKDGKSDEATHASGSTAAAEASEPQFQVDAQFQGQLAAVFSSYIKLKDAFVESDGGKVAEEARQTAGALAAVDMKLLSGAAHNDWMTYLSPIQSALTEMQETNDIGIQRGAFSNLSDNMYKSIKAFGLGGQEAFYEYCPMAFNNEGAYWLSLEEEIKNPYFGESMLTCGQVKEKLK